MRGSGSLLCECGCVGVFWGPAGDGARDPGSSSELQHQPPLRRAGFPGSCLGCMRGHLGQGLERALEKCCYRVGWMLFKVFRESSISFDVEVTYAAGRVLFGACIRDECPVPAYLRRKRTKSHSDEPGGSVQVVMPVTPPTAAHSPTAYTGFANKSFPPTLASKLLMT